MVFATARTLGWLAAPARAEHVGFGLVLGADKRKLASREGDPPRLAELIENAIATAEAEIVKLEAKRKAESDAGGREHTPLPDDVRREVARMAGIGSIKYADLAADRIKDYVFDLSRMVKFIGNTAGYSQYVYARVRSVFRFAPEGAVPGPIQIALPEERALALQLLGFGAAVKSVGVTLQPHHLVGYVFELATVFTAFYEKCPIVRSDVAHQVRGSRLALADVTARTIACGLALLGIEVPDRM
jgi:arginyl-tRNA synthetase